MPAHQQWDIVSGIGITALVVAGGRAIETADGNGLIADPYADALLRAADPPFPMPAAGPAQTPAWRAMTDHMAVRTRFLDDWFTRAATSPRCQGVILAAGLDTRAHRLDLPADFRVFEIDQPLVLEYKEQVLEGLGVRPAADRRTVPVDLRDDWPNALRAAGFDPALPTAWLAEGLLLYVPAAAEVQLLSTVHSMSAPNSQVALESADDRSRLFAPERQSGGETWGFDFHTLFSTENRPSPEGLLHEHGWTARTTRAREVASAGAISRRRSDGSAASPRSSPRNWSDRCAGNGPFAESCPVQDRTEDPDRKPSRSGIEWCPHPANPSPRSDHCGQKFSGCTAGEPVVRILIRMRHARASPQRHGHGRPPCWCAARRSR